MKARRIVLASRPGPEGPVEANFRLAEATLPEPGPGEALLETLYLSLDPYMRARMYEGVNYAASTAIGDVMPGATVSRVLAANGTGLRPGAIVESWHGWRSHAVVEARGLREIDPEAAPVTTALGVLGMPGHTGYGGLLRHGRPRPGETVVVSAASGAVGSVVGQVARIRGARVVGIASGPAKRRYLIEDLGLDAAIDRRSPSFANDLAAACPDGIDVYFDNVGGAVFTTVFPLLNAGGRVPICGTIAIDRDRPPAAGVDHLPALHATILVKQLTLRGFLYDGLLDMADDFRRDVAGWIREGKLRYREDIVDGLERAPRAFLGLFRGDNFGKLLVRVADTG